MPMESVSMSVSVCGRDWSMNRNAKKETLEEVEEEEEQ